MSDQPQRPAGYRVKDLIARLEKQDPDAVVVMVGKDGNEVGSTIIHVGRAGFFTQDAHFAFYGRLSSEATHEASTPAVVLTPLGNVNGSFG